MWSEKNRVETLRYMYRNPVKRVLVEKPGGWEWSRFTGEHGTVEIESEWTARRRERMGIRPQLKVRGLPHPSKSSSGGAPSRFLGGPPPVQVLGSAQIH